MKILFCFNKKALELDRTNAKPKLIHEEKSTLLFIIRQFQQSPHLVPASLTLTGPLTSTVSYD